jgi:hypothetical protein
MSHGLMSVTIRRTNFDVFHPLPVRKDAILAELHITVEFVLLMQRKISGWKEAVIECTLSFDGDQCLRQTSNWAIRRFPVRLKAAHEYLPLMDNV